MKVTKLIREYVEDEVRKAFDDKKNPYSEQAKKDRELIESFKAQLRAEQQEKINAFIETTGMLDAWRDFKPYRVDSSAPAFTAAATPAMMQEAKFKEKIVQAKKNRTREIMLQLELGANRAELNEMLSNLLSDVGEWGEA